MPIRDERTHGSRAVARKEAKGKMKVARETTEHVGLVVKTGDIAAWSRTDGNNNLHAIDEDESESIEETPDNDEELQAWKLVGRKWKRAAARVDQETRQTKR